MHNILERVIKIINSHFRRVFSAREYVRIRDIRLLSITIALYNVKVISVSANVSGINDSNIKSEQRYILYNTEQKKRSYRPTPAGSHLCDAYAKTSL